MKNYYRHKPIAIGIDVYNIEAKAYGARIPDPGSRDVPSVERPIVGTAAKILDLYGWDPETESRFGLAFEAAAMLMDKHPEAVVRIPLGGPFSIASTLMGFDYLLCDSITDGDAVREALVFLARQQLVVAHAAYDRSR